MGMMIKAIRSLFRQNEPEEAVIPDPFPNSRCTEKPVLIYFAPHQDDELLTLGVDACRALASGEYNVHVVLCTDGSKSNKRFEICNGKDCPLHPGIHQYELDIPQFIAARDLEFRGSCDALGYAPSAIHYFPMRAIDSFLSVETAEATLRKVLAQFPQGTAVRTISPYGGKKQHADHRNLGQAALNLYREGCISDLRLFIEPYCIESCREAHPDLKLTVLHAGESEKARIDAAIRSYSTWAPEKQRYAIGYHSVTTVFQDFSADPIAYYHLPDCTPGTEV